MKNKTASGKAAVPIFLLALFNLTACVQWDFNTDYFRIQIDKKGFVTSMKNITVKPHREFSPADKPSPLMCLYDSKQEIYYKP